MMRLRFAPHEWRVAQRVLADPWTHETMTESGIACFGDEHLRIVVMQGQDDAIVAWADKVINEIKKENNINTTI